jgi:transposase
MLADQADHVLGIDTHRDSHSAAILATDTAVVQGQTTVAANERGYRRLLRFALENAPGRRAWAVEGTGSYGAGLTVFLHREGELVLEVDRPRRPARRDRAKSDELDAIRAAREALTREHLARPRQRGEREALRVLLATRDSAVRSKRAAITLMKGLLVSASPTLREGLRALPTRDQLARCARLRISPAQDAEQRATTIAIRARAPAEHSHCRTKRSSSKQRSSRSSPTSRRGYWPRWRRRDHRRADPLRPLPPRTHPLRGRVRIARRRRAHPGVLRANRAFTT